MAAASATGRAESLARCDSAAWSRRRNGPAARRTRESTIPVKFPSSTLPEVKRSRSTRPVPPALPAQIPRLLAQRSRDQDALGNMVRRQVGGQAWCVGTRRHCTVLCLTTLQRAGEVIGLPRDELGWPTRSWVVASARSKNRRAHHVPLSSLSQLLIRRALALATATSVSADIERPLPRLVTEYWRPVFPAIHGNGPVDRRGTCDEPGLREA
jgi:integrase